MFRTQVQECIKRMLLYLEAADYAGYDPYDALNSPLLRRLGRKSKVLRMGATQFLRRCPVNLRPLLGISPGHNPKGLGLFLGSYAGLCTLESPEAYRDQINRLLALLRQTSAPGYAGRCWGYNFPWQSRLVYRSPYTPTVVNTAFIGHGLLDVHEAVVCPPAWEMAVSTRDFLLTDLSRKRGDGGFCFSYSPGEHDYVHNANALGASLLLRIAQVTGDVALRDTAFESMGYTVRHQREDGAWCFAEGGRSWVDSYHTGFVLESLRYFVNGRQKGYPDWRESYARGVKYYAENFFLADGTPKHYDNAVHPIDIHSAAEAICFFSKERPRLCALTEKIGQWTLRHLWDPRGFFYYRQGRLFRTKIPYMRWSQAWGLRALVAFALASPGRECGERDHPSSKPASSGGHSP